MLRNHWIIAWRNLMRHRLHTAINLAGLGLGMAFCLLAWRFASQEWSFDRFHGKADRIYRVYMEITLPEMGKIASADMIELAFAPELEALSPLVERTVRLSSGEGSDKSDRFVRTTFGGVSSDEEVLLVDPGFFEVFDFPLRLGDAATALAERNSVVLGHEMAQRLFGGADPLGQSLSLVSPDWGRAEDFTITGVAAPVPRTSSIRFNMLLPFDNSEWLFMDSPDEWEGTCNAYVLLRPGADPADLAPALAQLGQTWLRIHEDDLPADFPEDASPYRLQPLTGLRSDTGLLRWVGHGVVEPRDPYISYILGCIALAVLLMGCINFVNLAIGRAALRAAEVGVRKAVGAGRGHLMRQFVGEAAVLSVLGLGAGCALAWVLLPAFNATFSQELSLGLTRPDTLGALAALLVLVSLGAGWYPALVLSRLAPMSAIRRSLSTSGITRISRVLVGVQLAISVALITCTLIMYHQLDHVMARDMGLDQERVIAVHTEPVNNPDQIRLVESMLNHHRIASITLSDDDFLRDEYPSDYRVVTQEGRESKTRRYMIDHQFVETMGLEVIGGRDFSQAKGDKESVVLISESAAAPLGLADPVGETVELMRVSPSGRKSRGPLPHRRRGQGLHLRVGLRGGPAGSAGAPSRPARRRRAHARARQAGRPAGGPAAPAAGVQRRRRLLRLRLLLPAAGPGGRLPRRAALATRHHLGRRRRRPHLRPRRLRPHRPRRRTPNQGDRHPQGPRRHRRRPHRPHGPRVRLARTPRRRRRLPPRRVVDARLARRLRLPHRPGPLALRRRDRHRPGGGAHQRRPPGLAGGPSRPCAGAAI